MQPPRAAKPRIRDELTSCLGDKNLDMDHETDESAKDRFRTVAEDCRASPGEESLSRTADSTVDIGGVGRGGSVELSHVMIGERIGHYEITGALGTGGMGVVLKAYDEAIDRPVAIKVLSSKVAANSTSVERFLVEARAAGKLSHPNTVPVYEVGEAAGIHYLVMEFAPGGSIAALLDRHGAFSAVEATRIAADAARGLAAAHKAGIIHRDMKPANLLIFDDSSIKIADFGLAKPAANVDRQLTVEGQILGTPYFMSPEQCEAGEIDHRSDIYSLGATYYALLTGANPYQDEGSFVRIMHAHCAGDVLDPRRTNPLVPEACASIVARATAKQPNERYQSAEEMLADLDAVLATLSGAGILLPSQSSSHPVRINPKPARRSFAGALLAAAGLLALGGGGAAYFLFGGGRGNNASIVPGGTPPNGDAEASASPTGEPILVGVLHSLTGTMGHSGTSVTDATLLAIDEINRGGGLLGRPIKAVVADGRSNPSRFAREARRLIEEEHVCTVFGCWTSASRKTVVPVFEELDHLLVYPVQYEGLEESPNVIYTGATPNQQIVPAVEWAYSSQSKRRFFLVGSDYVFPRVAHAIIKDQLQQLGAELAGEAFLPLGSTEVQPIVAQIQQSKPDVILNCINGDSNLAFFANLRAAGIEPRATPTISFSVEEEELRQLDPDAMAGDYAAWNYFQSVESPENKQFVASFQAKYGPQRVVTDPMESAYLSVELWAQAVAECESTDVRKIRRAMLNQRMTSPGGMVRIDPATQHAFKTPRIGQVRADGQFEVVWTASQPEPPCPYPASRSAEEWRAFLHDLYKGWGNRWAAPQ